MEQNALKMPEKNYGISLLRLIAMVFIILCHFFQYYRMELASWFNVGVQMFFCVSGFLYGNKKIDSPTKFIGKNFKKILIPYFCFIIPAIILFYIFASKYVNPSKLIYVFLTSKSIKGIKHLWFISYILFCYAITPLLSDLAERFKKLKWPAFLGACGLFMLFVFAISKGFNSYFYFNRFFCYLFGYFAAVFFENYKISIFKKLTVILIITTIIMNIARIYFKYLNPDADFPHLGMLVKYAHAFLGISIVLIFIIWVKNIKRNAILDFSNKYSFYIYIVHQMFILGPFSLMKTTDCAPLNYIIILISIFVCAIILKLVADLVTKGLDRFTKFCSNHICR